MTVAVTLILVDLHAWLNAILIPVAAVLAGWLAWEVRQGKKRRESTARPDYLARSVYTTLLHEGDTCLRNLEQAAERLTHKGLTAKQMNDRLQWVTAYLNTCLGWMAHAQDDLATSTGEVDIALFISHPHTRPKPKYIENEPELGVWLSMAGRLDWLREQLAGARS